jgi:hypothetical protein
VQRFRAGEKVNDVYVRSMRRKIDIPFGAETFGSTQQSERARSSQRELQQPFSGNLPHSDGRR